MSSDNLNDTIFQPGDKVQDKEKQVEVEGEQYAVVILNADGNLTDWTIEEKEDGEDITVADQNPEYDENQHPVIVAWKNQIEEKLKWREIEPERLFKTCCSAGVGFYAFPEKRLEKVEEE